MLEVDSTNDFETDATIEELKRPVNSGPSSFVLELDESDIEFVLNKSKQQLQSYESWPLDWPHSEHREFQRLVAFTEYIINNVKNKWVHTMLF